MNYVRSREDATMSNTSGQGAMQVGHVQCGPGAAMLVEDRLYFGNVSVQNSSFSIKDSSLNLRMIEDLSLKHSLRMLLCLLAA